MLACHKPSGQVKERWSGTVCEAGGLECGRDSARDQSAPSLRTPESIWRIHRLAQRSKGTGWDGIRDAGSDCQAPSTEPARGAFVALVPRGMAALAYATPAPGWLSDLLL